MATTDQNTPEHMDAEAAQPVTEIAPMRKAEIIGLSLGESIDEQELERRLLEFGLVEGASISVLHEGLFGRDPIVLQVDDARIALRRAQAGCIKVRTLD